MSNPADYLKLIVECMHADNPAAWRGAAVGVRELRATTGLTDLQLLQGLLWGQMTGVLSLQCTERALATDEMQHWLRTNKGWIICVSLRQN